MLVVVPVTVCVIWLLYKRRRGDSKSDGEPAAETTRSDYATVMHDSSAYGRVSPGGNNSDSSVKLQASNAYGVGVKRQPTSNVPMYEIVT